MKKKIFASAQWTGTCWQQTKVEDYKVAGTKQADHANLMLIYGAACDVLKASHESVKKENIICRLQHQDEAVFRKSKGQQNVCF